MAKWKGDLIEQLALFRPRMTFFGLPLIHLLFIALYAAVLYWQYATIGQPYAYRREAAAAFDPAKPRPCAPLPAAYLPSFSSRLGLGASVILHVFVVLCTKWNVGFACRIHYTPAYDLASATVAKVVPPKHKGKTELVSIERMPSNGAPTFRFQELRFCYEAEQFELWQGAGAAASAPDAPEAMFRQVSTPTNAPVAFYSAWRGLSAAAIPLALERFGPNRYEIPMPTFSAVYREQLLSPFTVFQFFCVMLWCLDEYWKYSLFMLGMLLVFEATVSFSRLKSLNILRSMNTASRRIWAFRAGTWTVVETPDLLPGDIISLRRSRQRAAAVLTLEDRQKAAAAQADAIAGLPPAGPATAGAADAATAATAGAVAAAAAPAAAAAATAAPNTDADIVPCDCLMLQGTAVVNEANLTGESVPQLKEGLSPAEIAANAALDILATHKSAVLYGGTSMLQHSPGCESSGQPELSAETFNPALHGAAPTDMWRTPDGGCVAYVLLTAFNSSQGRLVRMIQFGAEKVSSGTRDVLLLMLFLLMFALASSGYVLHHGLERGRDQFKLLLHCILIITSVIPPDLNMQLAMTVNSSLMTLMRANIFCTEPFRIPLAGAIDSCFFDKTGTITTDKLVTIGVVRSDGAKDRSGGGGGGAAASAAAASAHAVPDFIVPVARAAVPVHVVLGGCHSLVHIDGQTIGDPLEEESLKAVGWVYDGDSGRCSPATPTGALAYTILRRHHFTSKLQRMSVIGIASGVAGPHGAGGREIWSLVKGSPEMIASLLAPGQLPAWYQERYMTMARLGMRVIALAYKRFPAPAGGVAEMEAEALRIFDQPREVLESGLTLAGLIAFQCKVRKDSAEVVAELRGAAHEVVMITGDALLTALHVAKDVGIVGVPEGRPALNLTEEPDGRLLWRDTLTDAVAEPFAAGEAVAALAARADLCATGKVLEGLFAASPDAWPMVRHVVVFARMTPVLKEGVLMQLRGEGRASLMCGDGANDVGALKQAHVGLALLSGFGNANVEGPAGVGAAAGAAAAGGEQSGAAATAGASTGDRRPNETSVRQRGAPAAAAAAPAAAPAAPVVDPAAAAAAKAEAAAKQRAEMEAKMRVVQENIRLRSERGEWFASLREAGSFLSREVQSAKVKAAAVQPTSFAESASMMAAHQELTEGGQGELPMVKLGDASIASSFTSKRPSIRGVVDVIRQGRCTLVTVMQSYQILALSGLIMSHSLSVLHLEGVKFGSTQMTAQSMLLTVSYFAISWATPLPLLSPVRPLSSIFHPALFFSILGQFAVHLAVMVTAVALTKSAMSPRVVDEMVLDGEFAPNLINTVVFLVASVQNVCVFAVNFKGRPWQFGLLENRALLWSLGLVILGAFACAMEINPLFNRTLELVAFPSDAFRAQIMTLLLGDVLCAFAVDRVLVFLFARPIFNSQIAAIDRATLVSFARFVAIIVAVFYYLLMPMLTEGARISAEQAAAEAAGAVGR